MKPKATKLAELQEKREKKLDQEFLEAVNVVCAEHSRTLVAIITPKISSINAELKVARVPKEEPKKVLETK